MYQTNLNTVWSRLDCTKMAAARNEIDMICGAWTAMTQNASKR